MSCWLWHSWGKWEQYGQSGTMVVRWMADQTPMRYTESRQKRICKDCGKVEDRLI